MSNANPLSLNAAELDAMRKLQADIEPPDLDDPIWDELTFLGLAEMTDGKLVLTPLGQRYKTD